MREIEIQRRRDPRNVDCSEFLKECAWAIYNSGIRLQTMRNRWPKIQKIFYPWDCRTLGENAESIRNDAFRPELRVRGVERKVQAIIYIASWLKSQGWDAVKAQLLKGIVTDSAGNVMCDPGLIAYLDHLPMIGDTNARFVAKNIGFDLAKPDRHLLELAGKYGYAADPRGVQLFTSVLSQAVGERISVVETVLFNACEKEADLHFTCPACGANR